MVRVKRGNVARNRRKKSKSTGYEITSLFLCWQKAPKKRF